MQTVEASMLKLPQVECPVIHRFGPGIYIREVSIPSGTFAIGHYQKQEHMNVMLKGRVTMIKDNGVIETVSAPFVYVGKPGRKIGYVHEDMVWQNIYATTETDVEKLEAMFLIKSETWAASHEANESISRLTHQANRDDYQAMLTELGISHETVKAQSENLSDQIPFPSGGYKVMVADSPLDGKGLFATASIAEGEVIAPSRIDKRRTPAGRFTNHSISPNARMVMLPEGDMNLVAIRSINGCHGGNLGEEITIDYRQAFYETMKETLLCQP